MSIQLYSYGACIRLVTDNSVVMLAKSQVKRIEVIRQDTVKLSLGDGTLNEILVKLADVTQPAELVDVAGLRDAITHMLDHGNQYEDEALVNQKLQISQLIEIKELFNQWYSSKQIDLNFQQLQVNGLLAIGNRLMESKENDERLIRSVQDQTAEVKAQSLQMEAISILVTAIKTVTEFSQAKQDAQNSTLGDIKGATSGVAASITNGLTEQKAQSSLLTAANTLLAGIQTAIASALAKLDIQNGTMTDVKTLTTGIQTGQSTALTEQKAQTTVLTSIQAAVVGIPTKQDAQTAVLSDLKTSLGQIVSILTDSLNELKSQSGKLATLDKDLSDIKAQNTVSQSKQDTIIQGMNDIKTLLKK